MKRPMPKVEKLVQRRRRAPKSDPTSQGSSWRVGEARFESTLRDCSPQIFLWFKSYILNSAANYNFGPGEPPWLLVILLIHIWGLAELTPLRQETDMLTVKSEFWRMSKRIPGSDLECTGSMLSDHFDHTMPCQKNCTLKWSILAALAALISTLGGGGGGQCYWVVPL